MMDWKLLLAQRIYSSGDDGGRSVSRPAVRIAVCGIAAGLAVMILSVAVAMGFKHQVRDMVTGLSAEVLVTSMDAAQSYQMTPVEAGDSLRDAMRGVKGVKNVQRFSTKPGMIMTEDNFMGMVLKGIASDYDLAYLRRHLEEGEIPAFSDTVSTNSVIVSRMIADRLKVGVGDRLYTYYVEEDLRARRLTVSGIYSTNFTAFDEIFLVTDLYTVNRLNNWKHNQVSGLEVSVDDYARLDSVNGALRSLLLDMEDSSGSQYYTRTIEDVYPQIFAWLDLLDLNVWVILLLMTGVAGFTMISGLLIIILERTQMIGTLKALGADDSSIRNVFLTFSAFVVGRGMVWGDVMGLAVCAVQGIFKVLRLDPATYYIDYVPVEFNVGLFLALNVATLVVSLAMLVGPSYLVCRISPVKTMRFE